MLPSSVKRVLTDDEHATRLASQFRSSDATSAGDLAASIRAASMRARKTVTEGYPSSPPSSPLKQAPAISLAAAAGYPLTARENNRQIFPHPSSGIYSPLPSPSKRKRSHPDSHDDDEQSIITPFLITPQSQDRGDFAMQLCGDDMVVGSLDRPMKPLRRSRRIGEVSPLSPTRSLLPCETEMNSHQCEEESTIMHSTQLL